MKQVLAAVFVQGVLLLSIFDIYFKSTVIQGVPPTENDCFAPAKRVVLFVADGLRADKFFHVPKTGCITPFLREIITNEGVWGISRTRVPTESRPGHVAIIAGLYEDPSAVFKGWKDNPVEFDSVFNRSRRTYAWGSPDIVPMFSKGSAGTRVKTFTYSPEIQDFSEANNATELNLWVLEKFKELLLRSKTDEPLHEDLKRGKLIYFFHLLATDVVGHSSKPQSKQYENTIIVSDYIVKEIVTLMQQFYRDNATSYIFTSDHGMTDWGSHGAGSVEETDTPLVFWGAGAAKPEQTILESDTPSSWKLGHLKRRDINQADIAPLISILLGIFMPVNSVGVLPIEYLNFKFQDSVKALLVNARQLGSQYNWHKKNIEEKALSWIKLFMHAMEDEHCYKMFDRLEGQLKSDNCTAETVLLAKKLIYTTLSGMEFYQNYYQRILQVLVALIFLGWSGCLICYLLVSLSSYSQRCAVKSSYIKKVDISFMSLFLMAIILLYAQSLPLLYYIYTGLPIILWWWVFRQLPFLSEALTYIKITKLRAIYLIILLIIGLETLVMSFFQREYLSAVMVGPMLWFFSTFHKVNTSIIKLWIPTTFFLAVFPLYPIVGSSGNILYVVYCGFLWIISWRMLLKYDPSNELRGKLIVSKILCIGCSSINSYVASLDLGIGTLNMTTHIFSWILLGISSLLLFYGSDKIYLRFIDISLSLVSPYILLSIGHEALFTFFLVIHLFTWMVLEYDFSEKPHYSKFSDFTLRGPIKEKQDLSIEDFRKSFFYLYYIFLSFFGIGNIASINSFDVNWVKTFITVFSPFLMCFLILLKTIIPFLLVTVAFRFINFTTKTRRLHMFIIVLIYCNIMSLHFFFRVSNKGSWLEIGMSISHFVIMQVVTIFLLGLYEIASLITPFHNRDILPKQL